MLELLKNWLRKLVRKHIDYIVGKPYKPLDEVYFYRAGDLYTDDILGPFQGMDALAEDVMVNSDGEAQVRQVYLVSRRYLHPVEKPLGKPRFSTLVNLVTPRRYVFNEKESLNLIINTEGYYLANGRDLASYKFTRNETGTVSYEKRQ